VLLLKSTTTKEIINLQVFEDSKLFIYWENNKCMMTNILFSLVMNIVEGTKNRFEDNSSNHILQEFKSKDNQLSKETFMMQEGVISVQEYNDVVLVFGSKISLLTSQVEEVSLF